MKQVYTIYRATNKVNGKVYVGFTGDYRARLHGHKHTALNQAGTKSDKALQKAIRKYGWDAFVWEILYQSLDRDHTLNLMEDHFIRENKSHYTQHGYNQTWGGDMLSEGYIGVKTNDGIVYVTTAEYEAGDYEARDAGTKWWHKDGERVRTNGESPGEGWTEGSNIVTNKDKKRWNNGIEETFSAEQPGPEWKQGALPENVYHAGKLRFTDGISEKVCVEGEQPEGWWLGRKPRAKPALTASELYHKHKHKHGYQRRSGTKWYTDGTQTGYYIPGQEPEGWVKASRKKNPA